MADDNYLLTSLTANKPISHPLISNHIAFLRGNKKVVPMSLVERTSMV